MYSDNCWAVFLWIIVIDLFIIVRLFIGQVSNKLIYWVETEWFLSIVFIRVLNVHEDYNEMWKSVWGWGGW